MSTPSRSEEPTVRSPHRPQVPSSVRFSPFFNEMFTNLMPEKTLRTAFYNAISQAFMIVVAVVIYYCYLVLRPFIEPLVWAILCGSALHPFKRRLLLCSSKWISDVKSDSRPISLATLLLPLEMIAYFIEWIIDFLLKYKKTILVVLIFMVVNYFMEHIWILCLEKLHSLLILTNDFLSNYLTNNEYTSVIITVVIGYLIILTFGWSEYNQYVNKALTYLSPVIWISLAIKITFICGFFGQAIALLLMSIVMIGAVQTLISSGSGDQTDGLANISLKIKDTLRSIAHYIHVMYLFENQEQTLVDTGIDGSGSQVSSSVDGDLSITDSNPNVSLSRRSSLASDASEDQSTSNRYLYIVLWAVVIVQLCSNMNFLLLLLIPISLKLVLMFVFKYTLPLIKSNSHRFNAFVEKRKNAIVHPSIRKLFHYFLIGDRVICDTIEKSLSVLTSLSVISITIISFVFISIFISIQMYGESIHMINSVSNVLNETIHSYPESGKLLPQGFSGADAMLDQMVRNGYEYGREYIKDFVQNALHVTDNNTRAVEKQILEIWDRAYHLWLIRNDNDDEAVPKKGPYDFDKLYNAFTTLDISLCFNIVKENIDLLLSVLDSVWLVLKGNISLLLSAIYAVLYILLMGGLGLMNLGLSFVIFTTALFYLLSASGEHYKPVELANRLFPSETSGQTTNLNSITNKFGRAVEEAVNGVFAASLKMSSFYGLYTYLIHVLFDVNIIYIPSVMAAILGAVPFLSPFWASFPASLELFFAHKQRTKAILLLMSAYFPSFFVDSTIYGEIKSAGHPYLTGLAIAGGVFYLGFEGAIFGPMLLCFLFVAFNMYTSIMEESPVKSNLKPPHLRRLQSIL